MVQYVCPDMTDSSQCKHCSHSKPHIAYEACRHPCLEGRICEPEQRAKKESIMEQKIPICTLQPPASCNAVRRIVVAENVVVKLCSGIVGDTFGSYPVAKVDDICLGCVYRKLADAHYAS